MSTDFNYDSDGEDLEWNCVSSSKMIDEFIDVNRGEKELIKLWNHHMSLNPGLVLNVILHVELSCLIYSTHKNSNSKADK